MSNAILSTAAETPSELRASARDLIARADMLEVQALLESGTRFWDIPGYYCRAQEGILLEHHEPGRPVEYRVMPESTTTQSVRNGTATRASRRKTASTRHSSPSRALQR